MSDSLLDDLNPQQRLAVTAGDGQILVLAGPGSGKTRVLTRRLAYLIERQNVPAYDIISVTFTNKAAREMEERVATLVQRNLEGIWLGTFHAMCARMLRREAHQEGLLPFNSNFVIFDSDDQETLVKHAMRELRIDEKLHRPASVHAAISTAKNDLLGPTEVTTSSYKEEVVARVYALYESMLRTNNAVDFDDLLLWGARLLREHPLIREKYASKFHHVLVDEFQDTNLAQYELLKHLSSIHQNIFVVGDEDQSIYRWRGADYRNVQRFEKDFPRCEKILLEQNYRSTQVILDAARSVIDQNRNRTPKHLFSDRGAGNKIVRYDGVDDHAEAGFVVDTIAGYLGKKNARARDFAVMYRTNAQSRMIEEAFIHAGLPYHLVGAQRFYGRREVKDVISFLRLVENPADEVSLQRVISVPPRGIGDKTMLNLQAAASQAGISQGEALLDLGRQADKSPFWAAIGRSAALLADFGAQLSQWVELKNSLPPAGLMDRILQDVGYREYIDDNSDEGVDRWENVEELRRLAFDYEEQGLSEFLQNLALVSDQDTIKEEESSHEQDASSVTLLTLHAAKGLEYKQVFIIGLDENILPHSRSRDDPEEMAEERRLFYVGITRAKDQLYLVRAERRSTFGSYDYCEPSRFLQDIDPSLVINQGKRGATRRASYEADMTWGPAYNKPSSSSSTRRISFESSSASAKTAKYKAGMRVRSEKFGEGIVLESKVESDGEEILDVHFSDYGLKHLLASLANLEII
jgi:DNA helicase-2/ATP-dependent DNA helicase PcrA